MTTPEMIYKIVSDHPMALYILAILVVLVFGVERLVRVWKGKNDGD